MRVTHIALERFRCFEKREFSFDKRFVVIEGNNGSGKTSLLEALYYACYLRSFRTSSSKELVGLDTTQGHFFLRVGFTEELSHEVTIGVSGKQKVVKFDDRPVKTYKEILAYYRMVSVTQDDLLLVQGAPEERRTFLDQSLAVAYPELLASLRTYKQVLQQRNSLLFASPQSTDQLEVWTAQLWHAGKTIVAHRRAYVAMLEQRCATLTQQAPELGLEGGVLSMRYEAKHEPYEQGFEAFWRWYQEQLAADERRWQRTLFGPHLDELHLFFCGKQARLFASRGQQKLLVMLIKLAQLADLYERGQPCALLLDDVLTDFDSKRLIECGRLLGYLPESCQLFITSPLVGQLTPLLLEEPDLIRL